MSLNLGDTKWGRAKGGKGPVCQGAGNEKTETSFLFQKILIIKYL
jgi:hypothetical protein